MITNCVVRVGFVILASLLLAAFVSAPAHGATYYVAMSSNDANPGTEAHSRRTIQKAAVTLSAGDTVNVKAGTYKERVVPQNSGNPGNYYDKDCPGEQVCWSTFAEVINGEIWMNGERIRMVGEGCYGLISCVFTGWDPYYIHILDFFRTLAGEKLIYVRASFSGPRDDGSEYVLPVWRDDRERYLSVLEDIINYAKSKNIYIVADLNHEVYRWFENEVGESDGAILNTSSQSYVLYMEYVTSIVERFKDEPYILAWETMNEPNLLPEWKTNGVEFCRQTYESIKAMDSNHMVFHGFDGPSICRATLDAIGTDHMDALCSHSYNLWVYGDYGGYSCSPTDEQREAAWDAYFSKLSNARIDYNLPVINTEIGSVCPEGIMGDPNNTGPESPNCPKLWNLIWSKFKQYDTDMMNGWAFIWYPENWKKTTYYQELKKIIFDVNPLPSGVDVPPNGKSLIIGLFQNYPNPFNTITNIKYLIAKTGHVELKVYTLSGQLVKTLVDRQESAGSHVVEWDGRNDEGEKVSSGIYLYCLKAAGHTRLKKCVVSK